MTVYAETREQSGVTIFCRSRVASWDGWPTDVVEVLRGWNKNRRLRFVGMDTIGRVPPQASFKCPDCERFINPSGSTAALFDSALVCDDCLILRVRKYGVLGRPETDLERCKRWQRNVQKKLAKYRHNALSEETYVRELKAALEAAERALADAEHVILGRGSLGWVGSLVLEGVRICLREGRWPDSQECALAFGDRQDRERERNEP